MYVFLFFFSSSPVVLFLPSWHRCYCYFALVFHSSIIFLRKCVLSMPSLNLCRRSREWWLALFTYFCGRRALIYTLSQLSAWLLIFTMIVKCIKIDLYFILFFHFLCRANYFGVRWHRKTHTHTNTHNENAIKMGSMLFEIVVCLKFQLCKLCCVDFLFLARSRFHSIAVHDLTCDELRHESQTTTTTTTKNMKTKEKKN